MTSIVPEAGLRLRLVATSALTRMGFHENAFLVPMAVLIGIVTSAAAVAFHELIHLIRDTLYERLFDPSFLYGHGVWLLVLLPALGGLVVGCFSTYVMRAREGHGIIDVMETVLRSSGRIRPVTAIEKILTSAVTIGSGGSAGAEGPIVQIGAAIASAFGQVFQVARSQMPILIGCGTAAGISSIFSSPMGGVLFTLEVILLDFSIRTFTPVVAASVVAYVTTQGIFRWIDPGGSHVAIFSMTEGLGGGPVLLDWQGMPYMVVLGLVCGLAGVTLTRGMYLSEERFHKLKIPRAVRPAFGGALLGLIGVIYVVVFGWLMLGRSKPFEFGHYPMPALFGDGYGVVQQLLGPQVYKQFPLGQFALLLLFLCLAKIVGTCLTLSSGGAGGVIAPSLFLGSTTGALLGMALGYFHRNSGVEPGFYALIGMGAVLAAVVHAPLASILILFELTRQQNVILPAMLACVFATGTARLLFKDSVYTLSLRRRGVRLGSGGDLGVLRQMTVEQVPLEPVTSVLLGTPVQRLLTLTAEGAAGDFVVFDDRGDYVGMIMGDDLRTALLQPEAIPLLVAGDLVHPELPAVRSSDDLGSVIELFARYEVAELPVCLARNPNRIIGLLSRRSVMRNLLRGKDG